MGARCRANRAPCRPSENAPGSRTPRTGTQCPPRAACRWAWRGYRARERNDDAMEFRAASSVENRSTMPRANAAAAAAPCCALSSESCRFRFRSLLSVNSGGWGKLICRACERRDERANLKQQRGALEFFSIREFFFLTKKRNEHSQNLLSFASALFLHFLSLSLQPSQ